MKRTLLEIVSGLVVLVLLASLHHQVAHLQSQNEEVDALRSLVRSTIANSSSKQDISEVRQELIDHMNGQLITLGDKVDAAERGVQEAHDLKGEVDAARREASMLKEEIERDYDQTRQLVDSYQDELRAKEKTLEDSMRSNWEILEELAGKVAKDPEVLTHEMLLPTVQLNGEDTVGSGTLVKSAKNSETGEVENYVLTSYHVVRNIFADTPSAKEDGIAVSFFGTQATEDLADMVSYDEKIDAALLKLRSSVVYPRVATVLPRGLAAAVQVWDPIFAIGCPLGNDPVHSSGAVSSKANLLNGTNYWMINAPTYYGNSGGGVFLSESYYMIGIFSKIYTHGRGNPVVVPHLGLCTPMDLVYAWLDRDGFEDAIPQPDNLDTAVARLRYTAPMPSSFAAAPVK